jgi:hypothetical protein
MAVAVPVGTGKAVSSAALSAAISPSPIDS